MIWGGGNVWVRTLEKAAGGAWRWPGTERENYGQGANSMSGCGWFALSQVSSSDRRKASFPPTFVKGMSLRLYSVLEEMLRYFAASLTPISGSWSGLAATPMRRGRSRATMRSATRSARVSSSRSVISVLLLLSRPFIAPAWGQERGKTLYSSVLRLMIFSFITPPATVAGGRGMPYAAA